MLTFVVLLLFVAVVLISFFVFVKYSPLAFDFTFGGPFKFDFKHLDNATTVIREIYPSKFPKANSMAFNISDFISSTNEEFKFKTITIDNFLEIILNPTTILTPFCMDKELNIIMIETPQRICLTNDKDTKMSFFYQSQAKACNQNKINKIYSIPISLLKLITNKIVSKLNDIDYNILFIHNMGRCGSNFMCNLLSNNDNIQCVKETNILRQITHCYLKQIKQHKSLKDDKTFNKNMIDLIKSNILLLVYALIKNLNYKKNKIVFKEASEVTFISHLIYSALLEYKCKHIYMYRNIFDQIDSMYTFWVMYTVPASNIINKIAISLKNKLIKYYLMQFMKYLASVKMVDLKLFGNIWAAIIDNINDINLLQILLIGYLNSIQIGYNLLKENKFSFALKYEDLKQNPNQIVTLLLQKLEWIKDDDAINIDKKTISYDSHHLEGGMKSVRKGAKDFVMLNQYDIQEIEKKMKSSKFQILNKKYSIKL